MKEKLNKFLKKFKIQLKKLINLIKKNISNVLNTNFANTKFNIIFLHIPISRKKDFIKLILEKVYNEIEDIRNGKYVI